MVQNCLVCVCVCVYVCVCVFQSECEWRCVCARAPKRRCCHVITRVGMCLRMPAPAAESDRPHPPRLGPNDQTVISRAITMFGIMFRKHVKTGVMCPCCSTRGERAHRAESQSQWCSLCECACRSIQNCFGQPAPKPQCALNTPAPKRVRRAFTHRRFLVF